MSKKLTSKDKKQSKIRELVKEATEELQNHHPLDPRIIDEAEELSGPERFALNQKKQDEVVIDSLLSSIAGKQGYFLKLKKEVRPNEWMLMKVIENEWRRWADIESEVSNIVKEHTKHAPQKWGSGCYRIEIACKGGMRGQTYDPIDVWVNAEEEFLPSQGNTAVNPPVDPSTAVASQIETLSNLVGMLKDVLPKGPDPSVTQQQIAQAFQQGMQMRVSESNNMTSLVVGMMTAMMSAMKDMVVSNKNDQPRSNPEEVLAKMLGVMKDMGIVSVNHNKEKTAIDFAKELQALGVELFKKDDPLEQVNKLKQIASIASDLMGLSGNSEKPSILEKLIDVLGPAVPKMVEDIKMTFQNAVQAQELIKQNKVLPQMQKVEQTPSNLNGNVNPQLKQQIKMFFDQLYDSVKSNNRTFYPMVYASLMQDVNGQNLIKGLMDRSKTAADVLNIIQTYGDERFKDEVFVNSYLIGYVNGFVLWVQNLVEKRDVGGFTVVCNKCGSMFEYASEQEFSTEQDKVCGVNINGTKCDGVLQPTNKIRS